MRLSWGAASLADLHICPVNLKVYVEVLTGFRYGYCPDGLNTTSLSQGYILGAASESGKANRMHMPGTG